jgi:hypothetical protein
MVMHQPDENVLAEPCNEFRQIRIERICILSHDSMLFNVKVADPILPAGNAVISENFSTCNKGV